MRLDRWNRPLCTCSGYEFIHRRTGGACIHNPDQVQATVLLMQRANAWPDEPQAAEDLLIDLRLHVTTPTTAACPF